MNREEVQRTLKDKGISEDMYSLNGGLPNESYCLEKGKDVWEVYYSERGVKTSLRLFDTEDEACQHLLKRVVRMSEL